MGTPATNEQVSASTAASVRAHVRRELEQARGELSMKDLIKSTREAVPKALRIDLIRSVIASTPWIVVRGGVWVSLATSFHGEEVERMPKRTSRASSGGKLSVEEFTVRAIRKLRDPKRSKGIHAVWTGFNEAFRAYFPGKDPVAEVGKLAESGVIVVQPCRGGVMLYLAGEAPVRVDSEERTKQVLSRIGV